MLDNKLINFNSFIKDGIRLIGGQVFIAILSIGNVIVTARALDVDGRGYLALALLFVSILCTFTEFGLGNAGTHFMATGKWTKQEILASHAFSVIVRCIVIGCIGILAVFFASEKIIPGVPIEYLYISIIQAPALLIASSILPLLLGIGLAKSYNRIQILSSIIGVGSLVIWWIIFSLDVEMALLINILVGFLIATITWIYTKNVIGGLAKINFGYLDLSCATRLSELVPITLFSGSSSSDFRCEFRMDITTASCGSSRKGTAPITKLSGSV